MWLKDGSFKIFHRIISFEALLSVIYLSMRVYFYDMTFSMYMYLLDANILLHVLNFFFHWRDRFYNCTVKNARYTSAVN